jgi:hypothetical protein
VESARFDPSPDRPPAEPCRHQLRSADHPVLAAGQVRDHRVRAKVAEFGTYTVLKFSTLAHDPDRASQNATELALSVPKFAPSLDNRRIFNLLSN